MAETKIEWCDYTFNPWRGCTKVSAGCKNCYAETRSKINPRVLGVWGDSGTRAMAAESYWNSPIKWNNSASPTDRKKVFCASLGDVFEDRNDLIDSRKRLFETIKCTPNLDWLLLTKRPENILKLWPIAEKSLDNIWLGTSVEDQENAELRIPLLSKCPAKIRFLSVEPLIGPIDFSRISCTDIDWIIIGGESGHHARVCNVTWIRNIVSYCLKQKISVFVKQLGLSPIDNIDDWPKNTQFETNNYERYILLNDKKGGDINEWPKKLKIRQFPME